MGPRPVRAARTFLESDGIEWPHMTETDCYDYELAAENTGVGPPQMPLNFAIS